jgi:outer membrane protein OmpA-like peptidoglycan-associated protein
MKSILRRIGGLLLIASTLFVSSCSLTSDLTKMEDPEDYEAYIAKWAPSEDAFLAVQRLAKPALDANDWNGAIAVFEKYRPSFPLMGDRFEKIVTVLREPSYDIELQNLRLLNSEMNEIKPSITVDGSRLYFASDREGGFGNLDIYVSDFEDGEWLPPVNIGERINTKEHETINGISFDGTKILVYGGFAGHLGNGDNFYYEKTARGWSNIIHFPPLVNSKFYDSDAFMTADGFAVLFTSDREGVTGDRVPKNTVFHGGQNGNTDIFVSVRRGTYWQPPINLGPVINTPYAERSAFLHPDGKTLYFSSDAHPGLGKMDVFKSIRLREDSWTEWSTPVNLGKDVNTSEDDWGYKITPDGKYAFYSAANRPGGSGQNDLYMITLPRAARPERPVATASGIILDDAGNPVDAVVMVQRLSDGEVVSTGQSDPETGKFMMSVPEGDNYAVFVEKEGYYPDSHPLDLTNGGDGRNGDGNNGDGRNGDGRNGDGRNGDGDGRNGDGRNGDGRNGDGRNGDGRNGDGRNGDGRNGDGRNGDGRNGDGRNGDGRNGDGRNGDGRNGDGRNGDGRDGDGRNGDGRNGDGRNGDGRNGDGRNGDGRNGDGRNGDGRNGDGRNGDGRNGDGRNGDGRNGDGRNGDGRNGDGRNGDGRNGDGRNGDGRNGDGRNGDGRNGDGRNGDGRNGDGRNGDGRNGDGRNGDGRNDDGGVRNLTFNFELKSVESMRSKRDKWGDLLAQGLNNIFFDFNKWDLKPESFFEIDRLARFLEINPDLRIVIAAHTDDIGSDEYNFDLSNKRARSVMDYLIQKKIDRSRLEHLGYGESRPAVPNDSDDNRAKNRRVEFRLAEE